MTKIKRIIGREIIDSRGNPTIATFLELENGLSAEAMVPSGASTGEHEAIELRDNDPKRYCGKGVQKAISNVNNIIAPALAGASVTDQKDIDKMLIDLDGTQNKGKLGANAILGVSLAAAKVAAKEKEFPLFEHLANGKPISLPIPMVNIVNGGAHANNCIDFQEFMIRPIAANSMQERVRVSAEVFHTLKSILQKNGESTAVGDEGGFAPNLKSNEETLALIVKSIEEAGYTPGKDVTIALDCAASFMFKDGQYLVDKKGGSTKTRSSSEQVEYLAKLCDQFPIDSIEDGLDENDWAGWKTLTKRLGMNVQIVGDDLFVTNPKFLKRGIEEGSANSILIKPNQIGTLSETLETIKMAKDAGFTIVISHRSGETEDTFIADLAVGVDARQIKTGSVSRSDRTAKYNRLMAIENILEN